MLTKPTLLVLAAGMGSRFGGLKQLVCVGPHGETIMDYSIYDAIQSGFGKVVFVIRHDFEEQFNENVLSKYREHIPVEVVFQEVSNLPEGYIVPEGRTKPWGTNHAVMMGANVINEPFAVINSDDFYGRHAFETVSEYLNKIEAGDKGKYCMVAFNLKNTMTENGEVSRGVCTVTDDGTLYKVVERSRIGFAPDGSVRYIDENGDWQPIDPGSSVSMNLWGFTPDYFKYSLREFTRFLDKHGAREKSEFFIPSVVDKLIRNGEASVKVLTTDSEWFGVTYAEDRPGVEAKLRSLHDAGVYPENMFK